MSSIEEENKLIAEFMGRKVITDEISWFDTDYKLLKYNDWNNLMPVVGKIEKLTLVNAEVELYWEEEFLVKTETHMAFLSNDFVSVYHRVLRFVKWYNKNKKE